MENKYEGRKTRNFGIDLLRIIAMFYVLVLHTLRYGGVLDSFSPGSLKWSILWFIEIWAYCSVNLFGLITGYVGFSETKKRSNYTNLGVLWGQIVFYGIVVALIYNVIQPSSVTKADIIEKIFPLTNYHYWYFTAYTGLMIVKPCIDSFLRNASPKMLKKLFVVIIVVFSFYESVTKHFWFNNGYSFIWLVILYILGAIIKKCEIWSNLPVRTCFFLIFLFVLIKWILVRFMFTFTFFRVIYDSSMVTTIYPEILFSGIFHLLLFKKINLPESWTKIVSIVTPSVFSAYILNCHINIWYSFVDQFIMSNNTPMIKALCIPLGFAFLFLAGSILVDQIRIAVFNRLHIKEFMSKLDMLAHAFVDAAIEKI